MKKLFSFLVAVMMLIPSIMFAQFDQTIGTGTDNYYLAPFCTSNNYSWTETIYPADEFPGGGVFINSLSWNSDVAQPLNCSSVKIYLGVKTSDQFTSNTDWTPQSQLTLVYEGTNVTLGQNAGWETFTLNDPYYYNNNNGNLVVVVAKSCTTPNGNTRYRYSDVENTFLYRQSTSSAAYAQYSTSYTGTRSYYRPNIKVNYDLDDAIAVDNIEVHVAGRNATVTWDAPVFEEPTGYMVEYKIASTDNWIMAANNVPTTTYTIRGLYFLKDYVVRITPIGVSDPGPRSKGFATGCLSGESYEFDVAIGNGTTTSSYLPAYSLYNHSLTEQIYRAEELQGEGTITSLTFQASEVPTTPRQMAFYLMPTTQSSVTSFVNLDASAVEVFSGSVPLAVGDNVITFSTPFEYDGTSNLMLVVTEDQSWSSSNYFYVHTNGSNYSCYVYDDGSAYNPNQASSYSGYSTTTDRNNIVFHFEANTCDTADNLRVLNLDVVTHGRTADVTWDMYEGAGYENVTGYLVEYKTTSSSEWIVAAENTPNTYLSIGNLYYLPVYTVRVTPLGAEDAIGAMKDFQLECQNGTSVDVEEDITIGESTETNMYLPAYSNYNYALSEQIYRAEELHGAGAITSLKFEAQAITTTPRRLTFYLMPTTQTSVTSFTPVGSSAVQVYSGTFNLTAGWNEVTFTTPFEYDGTSNLMLITSDQTGTYTYGNNYYVHSNGSNYSYYDYDDYDDPIVSSTSSTSAYSAPYRNNIIFHISTSSNECDTAGNLRVQNLTVTTNRRTAVATWDPATGDGAEDITGYMVEIRKTTDAEWTLATPNTPNTTWTFTDLYFDPTYIVRVTPVGSDEAGPMTEQFQLECPNVITSEVNEDVTVGTGTTTSYQLPVNNLWCYTYSQQIYLANELNMAGQISSIAFKYNYSTSMTAKTNVSIYLAHTNKTSFSSTTDYVPASNFQLVYTGPLNCSNGWNTFEFTTPFNYNGNDNLVLMVDDNSGNYNSSSDIFSAHTTSDSKTISYYSDSYNPDITAPQNSGASGYLWSNRSDVRFHFGFDGEICDTLFCHPVTNLSVAGVNSHRATLAWTRGDSENFWDMIVSTTPLTPDMNAEPTYQIHGNPSYILGNLEPGTTYYVYVRPNCGGEDGVGPWEDVTFTTEQTYATVPYECDFENEEADNWSLVNGDNTNRWVVGNATGNTGRSLYISQDDGATNTYDFDSPTLVFAFRDFEFPASENGYQVSFDWRAEGEYYDDDDFYDFGNMFISDREELNPNPDVATIPASSQALLSHLFYASPDYQTTTLTLPGYTTPTIKRIFFLWYNDYSDGENPPVAIDNFRITILNCIAPENLTAHNITYKQAELSWAPGDATQWDVYYTTSSDQPAADVVPQYVGINTLPLTITGLDENTTYYAYVRTNCGDEVSVWTPVTFTTTCSSVANIPYSQDFDATALETIPTCWTRYSSDNNEGVEYPYVSDSYQSSGDNSLYFYNPYATSNYNYCYATTEAIDMTSYPENSLVVSFNALIPDADYGDFRVGFMTDPSDPSTFTSLMAVAHSDFATADDWNEFEVIIPNHYDQPVYLAIMASAADYNEFYIDDVKIDVIPTCSDLTNLTVTDIAGTSARVSWDAAPYGNNAYLLEYKESESETWNAAIAVEGTHYILDGLDIETSYDIRVTTDCATATEQAISFTTACLNGAGGGINSGDDDEPGVGDGSMPEVTIGEGSGTSYSVPTNTLYNYSIVEQIYLASEIGESGTINSISFPYSGGDPVSRNVNVYLVHTTRSSFTSTTNWILPSSSDLVYSGTMSCSGSDPRLTITLTTPFEYDGTSNLALIMQDNTGSWSSRYFYTYPTGSNRALYVYRDASSYSFNSLSSYTGYTSTDNSQIIFNFGNTSGSGSGTTPSTGVPETVTIGTGTSQYSFLPSTAHYNYAYSQQVYLASELGGAGTINSVAFNCASNGGVSRNYTVYLMPTTQNSTNGSWVTYSNAQQVFSGYVNINNGWNTITFTTPYEYDGTSNLVLMVDDNTSSYISSYPYFYYSSITGTSSVAYSDTYNPVPSSMSTSYSGSTLYPNYRMNTQFNITRTGGGGGSTPGTGSGDVVTEVEIGTGTNTSNYFPSNSCYNYSYSQQIYTAAELGEAGSITALAFNCSSIESATRNFTIYLMPTTQTSTNSSFLPFVNAQQVYTGNVNLTLGWNTITFATPYEYDGVSNIAVLVDDNTGSWSCSNSYLVSSISGTSSCVYGDGTNPSPTSPSSSYYEYPNSRMNAIFSISRSGSTPPPASSTEVTEVEIGTGTNTSNYFPSNSCYNYSYSQQIYTAAELGEAGSITAIAFNCYSLASTTSSNVNRNLTIYLMPTTQTSTNSSFLPFVNAQQVYSGMLNTVTGWNTITFNTPYEYDGVSNVAVLIDDNTGAYSCSNYYYVSTITGTSSSAYSDSYNPVPSSMSSYAGTMTYPNSRMNAKFTIERVTLVCDNDPDQCVAPNVFLQNGRATDFSIDWAAGNLETAWQVYLTNTNDEPTETTTPTDDALTQEYSFEGLQPNTTYYAYVRSVCGTDEYSIWSEPVVYTTPMSCGDVALPYNEDFSDYAADAVSGLTDAGVSPDCWTIITDGTAPTAMPKISNNSSYVPECDVTSEYLLMTVNMADASYPSSQIAVLPHFDAAPGHITFNARMTDYRASSLTLGYVTPDNEFTALMDINTTYICGQVFNYSFCGQAIPADARLAFKFDAFTSEYSANNKYAMIDNIEVGIDGGVIADYDGNTYTVAQIGSNCWMTENLRSEHYSNGIVINGAYDYNDDPANSETYGKLYNWYAAANLAEGDDSPVTDPHQGVCPAGWHLPTVADYAELIALSGDNAAKLKSNENSAYWLGQFGGETPGIGFDAVPAGILNGGNYTNLLGEAYFWTIENVNVTLNKALCLLYYCPESFWKDIDHHYGLSIRCVRD